MKSELLRDLLDHFAKRGDPKYISNADLLEYFISNRDRIDFAGFAGVRDYFLDELKVTRYAFREISAWFKDDSPETGGKRGALNQEPPGMERFREALALKRYSRRTVRAYLGALNRMNAWFVREEGITVDHMTTARARNYFLNLTEKQRLSASLIRIYRFALALYFRIVLDRELDLSFLDGMKKANHLPTVLSRGEIAKILDCTENIKHRTMIGMLYASGLRLSELVALRAGDVNLEELTVHVRGGKGNKDRITIFSASLVDGLSRCLEGKTAADYVFTPSTGGTGEKAKPLSGRTVQKILEAALRRAGIGKRATPHDLRHAFATHLLENGISLRHIQLLLGHKNIATTTIYTKVASPALRGIKSPL